MGEYAPGKSAGAPQGLPETFSEDEGARNSSNPGYSGYSKDLRYTDTNSKACLQHAKTNCIMQLPTIVCVNRVNMPNSQTEDRSRNTNNGGRDLQLQFTKQLTDRRGQITHTLHLTAPQF